MSLHDEVTSKYPFPEIGVVDCVFQTKSLAKSLSRYTIDADGKLYDNPIGTLKVLYMPDGVSFHQDVFIYTYRNDAWHEFRIRFTNGKVSDIESIKSKWK